MIRIKNISEQPVTAGGRIIDSGKTSTIANTFYSAQVAGYLYGKLDKKIEIHAYNEFTKETKLLETEQSFIEYLGSDTFTSEPPKVKTKEIETPEVETEESKAPEEKTEEIETPEAETPKKKTEEVKTPEVETEDSEAPIEKDTPAKKSKRTRKK